MSSARTSCGTTTGPATADHSPASRYEAVPDLAPSSEYPAPMRIDQAVNIEDLHRMAKRRLPKVAFDFIEGGLEDERGLDRNTAAFHKHNLLPRYLVDVSKRDQSQTIFGKKFNSPFGISPTGGAGLFRRGADQIGRAHV